MMLFANATRRPRRAGWIATAGAASLIFGAACSSKSDPDPEYPDPPPAQTGTEQPTGDEHAAPAEPPGAAQPGAAQPGGEQPQQAQQSGGQPGQAQGAPAQGGDVSDEEVMRFVAAYASIMELQAGYQEEFQEAETPEDAQEIEQRAQEEVSEAIEDEGLTPQRFDEIARQVQMDPELQQRVQQELGGPGQP